jgi:hypothetical protein
MYQRPAIIGVPNQYNAPMMNQGVMLFIAVIGLEYWNTGRLE